MGNSEEVCFTFFRGLLDFEAAALLAGAAPFFFALADGRAEEGDGVPATAAECVPALSSLLLLLDFLGTVLKIFIELASLSRFASSFCETLADSQSDGRVPT